MMKNQPLSSSDQGKILIFTLLMAPSVIFIFGAIPAIFLVFGLYMMKKNQDFSSIETAVRNFRGYTSLALIGCVLSSLYWGNIYFNEEVGDRWRHGTEFFVSMTFAAIAVAYFIVVHALFFKPLKTHSEWISVNGIFSSKPKSAAKPAEESELNIIKGEKLRQYSVADELLKWAKLKEEGHISEAEFNEARSKLLRRN